MRIACRPTSQAVWFNHLAPHLPAQGLSFLAKKIVGDGQLPDLGMEIFNLLFVNLRCFSTTALKDARRALQQGALPLMDHRGMHAEPTGQITDRLLAFQRLQRDPCLEFRVMLFPFRHL